jgi:hypothetical protein
VTRTPSRLRGQQISLALAQTPLMVNDEGPSLMRTGLDPASFHTVSATRVLSLELEQWPARPVGNISDQAGHTVAFEGWVAFAAALEKLCGSATGRLVTLDTLRRGRRRSPSPARTRTYGVEPCTENV